MASSSWASAFGVCLLLCAPSVLSSKISPDGSCGPAKGYTCQGSNFGNSCGRYNLCGRDPSYCKVSSGCQPAYGFCYAPGSPSPDGTCGGSDGLTCKGSGFGTSCGPNGRCGSDAGYNGAGCNPQYGSCAVCTTTALPSTYTSTVTVPATTLVLASTTISTAVTSGVSSTTTTITSTVTSTAAAAALTTSTAPVKVKRQVTTAPLNNANCGRITTVGYTTTTVTISTTSTSTYQSTLTSLTTSFTPSSTLVTTATLLTTTITTASATSCSPTSFQSTYVPVPAFATCNYNKPSGFFNSLSTTNYSDTQGAVSRCRGYCTWYNGIPAQMNSQSSTICKFVLTQYSGAGDYRCFLYNFVPTADGCSTAGTSFAEGDRKLNNCDATTTAPAAVTS